MKPRVDSPAVAPLFLLMKKCAPFVVAGLFAGLGVAFAAPPTIPQRPPPEAFHQLTEDWPFALATPVAAAAEPAAPPWSSNLYVSGIGRSYESGKEEIFVAIKKKDATGSYTIFGDQPNKEEDVAIGGVEWSDSLGKSRVTLKHGGEFATIEFDPITIQTPAAGAPAQARPGMPILPGGVRPPIIRPPGNAAMVPRPANIPQPVQNGQRPVAVPMPGPSNTNAISPNAPQNQNANPNPRTRVRVIPSPQQ